MNQIPEASNSGGLPERASGPSDSTPIDHGGKIYTLSVLTNSQWLLHEGQSFIGQIDVVNVPTTPDAALYTVRAAGSPKPLNIETHNWVGAIEALIVKSRR